MNRTVFKYIGMFLLLMATDVFVVSNIDVRTWIVPHIYPLFILLLPVRTSKSMVIALGFFTGLVADTFLLSGGLHAASTTFMAFMRIFLLPAFATAEDYDGNHSPNIASLGQGRFLTYAGVMILIHHSAFFSLEIFSFRSIVLILMKVFASSMVSVLLIWLIQLLSVKKSISHARRVR